MSNITYPANKGNKRLKAALNKFSRILKNSGRLMGYGMDRADLYVNMVELQIYEQVVR